MALEPSDKLEIVMRGLTLLTIAQLQTSGALPARNDGKPLDVLLVEAGYSQREVGQLLGRSQQAISDSVKKHVPAASSKSTDQSEKRG